MSTDEFQREELATHIKRFEADSNRQTILYRVLRYSSFALSAAASVLGDLAIAYGEWKAPINVLIVLATSTISTMNSIESLRKFDELWFHERQILHLLSRDTAWDAAADQPHAPPAGQAQEAA